MTKKEISSKFGDFFCLPKFKLENKNVLKLTSAYTNKNIELLVKYYCCLLILLKLDFITKLCSDLKIWL